METFYMAKDNGALVQPLTVRTSAGLRDALFDELDALRTGTSNPAKANAVAKLADQVVATVKMELDVQKHLLKVPASGKPAELPAPVTLGHN